MTRAVLVMDRSTFDDHPRALAEALDTIAAAGFELVGVMAPGDFRRAHGLIADDKADVLIVPRREELPSVAVLPRGDEPGVRRTEPILRPDRNQLVPARQRRPRRTQLLR